MSLGNGKADDGTPLVVPVASLYHERSRREEAEGRAADAERKAERLERELDALRAALDRAFPDSPLARQQGLRRELEALRRR